MIADSMTYGVNPPLQERSQHTLDRIVSAAESLIREKGLDGTSISEIVSRAEVSVGSFHARFRGKESLLQCLDERIWKESRQKWKESLLQCLDERIWKESRQKWDELLSPARWQGAHVEDVVREIVRVMVRGHRKYDHRLRALGLHACIHPEATTTKRTAELNAYVFEKVRDLLLCFQAAMAHPDPSLAAEFGFQLVLATLHDRILLSRTGWNPMRLSDGQLIDELSRTYLAYLGVAPKNAPH